MKIGNYRVEPDRKAIRGATRFGLAGVVALVAPVIAGYINNTLGVLRLGTPSGNGPWQPWGFYWATGSLVLLGIAGLALCGALLLDAFFDIEEVTADDR